jgi:hypothetical protein
MTALSYVLKTALSPLVVIVVLIIGITIDARSPATSQVVYCNGVRYWGACPTTPRPSLPPPPPEPECPNNGILNSRGGCNPAGSVMCSGGRYCETGYKCAIGGGCVKTDSVYCGGSNYCAAGFLCGSGTQCLAPYKDDCGNGTSCGAGTFCSAAGDLCERIPTLVSFEDVSFELARSNSRLSQAVRTLEPLKYRWGLFRTKTEKVHNLWDFREDVGAAVQIIATEWAIAVPSTLQIKILRDRIDSHLKGLMKDTIKQISELMIRDVKELTPFWDDYPAQKAAKKKMLEDLTTWVHFIETDSIRLIDTRTIFRETPKSSHIIFEPGESLRELKSAAENPDWLAHQCDVNKVKRSLPNVYCVDFRFKP